MSTFSRRVVRRRASLSRALVMAQELLAPLHPPTVRVVALSPIVLTVASVHYLSGMLMTVSFFVFLEYRVRRHG